MKSQLAALVLLALALILALRNGGFAPTEWYPAALFALALVALAFVVDRGAVPPTTVIVAMAAFALFTIWSYASIAWADVPADAWDGANRTLLYLLVLLGASLRPWSHRSLNLALAIVVVGVAGIAGGLLLATGFSEAPGRFFVLGRLSAPTGYANATAALLLISLWPALHFATARSLIWPLRGLALGATCLNLQVAVLTGSRGAAIALACTVVVYLLLVPRRWPAIGAVLVLTAVTAAAWNPLTAVEASGDVYALAQRTGEAGRSIAASCATAVALGSLAALVGTRLWDGAGAPARLRGAGDLSFVVITVIAVLAAAGLAATNGSWLEARWKDFKSSGYERVERDGRFSGSLGSGRYDFYRVAYEQFRLHAVRGIGADNFAVPYLMLRRTNEAPLYPHSLVLRVPSQLGMVGIGLFGLFLASMTVGGFSGWRQRDVEARSAAVGALSGGVFWLVHGAGDWLWEMPAVSMLAVTLLAVFARSDRRIAGPRRGSVGGWKAIPVRLAASAFILLASLSLALPWLSARYFALGRDLQRSAEEGSYAALTRAASINRLSADPLIARALVARRVGRVSLARRSLLQAVDREPLNWFVRFELALLEAESGAQGSALRELATAEQLNPRQPLIGDARALIRRGERISADELERRLFGQRNPSSVLPDPEN